MRIFSLPCSDFLFVFNQCFRVSIEVCGHFGFAIFGIRWILIRVAILGSWSIWWVVWVGDMWCCVLLSALYWLSFTSMSLFDLIPEVSSTFKLFFSLPFFRHSSCTLFLSRDYCLASGEIFAKSLYLLS